MISVGTYEAKTTLTELIKKVMTGESITITNHKKAVARLVPPIGINTDKTSELLSELLEFSTGKTLGDDISLNDLISEGRR